MVPSNRQPGRARRLAAVAIAALGLAGAAQAQTYDFNRFLSGGAGGTDPQKRRTVTQMGTNICLSVTPSGQAARFMIWSRLPHPNSRIRQVFVDLGRHADLITGISVAVQSPGVKASPGPGGQLHAFLPRFTPRFVINTPTGAGMAPGNMLVLAATLGAGKTYNDVLTAIHEGLNPTSGSNGLRIGVIAQSMLGGPPPGVPTIMDDGGFVTASPSAACQGG